jgi:hypothetical protein
MGPAAQQLSSPAAQQPGSSLLIVHDDARGLRLLYSVGCAAAQASMNHIAPAAYRTATNASLFISASLAPTHAASLACCVCYDYTGRAAWRRLPPLQSLHVTPE